MNGFAFSCFHLFSGEMQLQSLQCRVFLVFFGSGCPCFILVAPATPISSKPVHCTDLVDASESRSGGKKKTLDLPWHRREREEKE